MIPQIPPIPSVPICDPKTGICSQEWWRWFHLVTTIAREQGSEIDASTLLSGLPVPSPDQLLSVASMAVPQDSDPDTDFRHIAVPADPNLPDQATLKALMLAVPR